ncbi:uncharacterized protein PgNI_07431 [Pyricularia grisea]|uniref:Uncharacterized protein n=1 Tax=Pyricularia grisea TaxID=148305 RepID=A0A6P8B0R9_PYRGI|nr:uncharacterized protein PgNI_07431 [Pyricularia grisea]TLD08429.1 hypothetical protein PgNI_07431 [Pyricularia grisea]
MEAKKELQLLSKGDRRMIEYSSRYWPEHASESGSYPTQDSLQTLIEPFLIDIEYNCVSTKFRNWCWMLHKNIGSPPHRIEKRNSSGEVYLYYSCQLLCNPIWLASCYNWLDAVEKYIYAADIEGLEEPRKLFGEDLRLVSSTSSNKFYMLEEELTPLLYAVAKGNFPLTECMLNSVPDLTQTNTQSMSKPLVRAAEGGDVKLVTLLLNKPHGGLVGEKDALIGAAGRGKTEVCRVCLYYNAELLYLSGTLAFIAACKTGNLETVAFLLDRGVSTEKAVEGLNLAALRERSEIVTLLLERGLGKNAMSKALIVAISNGDTKTTTVLLDNGAEKESAAVLRATRDDTPVTALRLIQQGFPATGRWGRTGRSPLHYASLNGREIIVAALLGAGVVVDMYGSQGQTPLHLSAKVGSTQCARMLLEKGADVLAEDDEGRIPLDFAEDSEDEACVTVIRGWMEQLMEALLRAKAGREVKAATIGTPSRPLAWNSGALGNTGDFHSQTNPPFPKNYHPLLPV